MGAGRNDQLTFLFPCESLPRVLAPGVLDDHSCATLVLPESLRNYGERRVYISSHLDHSRVNMGYRDLMVPGVSR